MSERPQKRQKKVSLVIPAFSVPSSTTSARQTDSTSINADDQEDDDDFDVTRHDDDEDDDENDDADLDRAESFKVSIRTADGEEEEDELAEDLGGDMSGDMNDLNDTNDTNDTNGGVKQEYTEINNGQDGLFVDSAIEADLLNTNTDGLDTNSVHKTLRRRAFGHGMSNEELEILLSTFSEEQMDRYETFRRSNVNKSGVKKLANAVLNQSIASNVVVTISGVAKVFLGDIIERARDVQLRTDPGLDGAQIPLMPHHIREAWRLYRAESGLVPAAHWRRQGGRGDGKLFR
ncbi:hTAFII28-like protein conserved region-domain-containing protein [Lipomyces oligophaga]|uniref:hTAFII28-like protein conserved region-domain-containing protein n=1 Tax=Lipomyces oligophaga TaxID=45792 RepID=UPI0034CD3C89